MSARADGVFLTRLGIVASFKLLKFPPVLVMVAWLWPG